MNKLSSKQIENWIKEISGVNIEKGWRQKDLEICDFASNLHGEISEAFEDYRNNKEINEVWYEYKIDGELVNLEHKFITNTLPYDELEIVLGKPCGIPSELSDIVIRALDMVGYYELEDYCIREFETQISKDKFELLLNNKFTRNITILHTTVSGIALAEHIIENLDYLIKHCFVIAKENNIDLIEQINDKITYNRTRPARHGNKRV